MTNRVARLFPLLMTCAVLVLAGCGQRGPSPSRAQTAAPSEPSFQTFGDLEVHYNALRTDELPAEVARAYGIERSSNRVMLNVSLLRKAPDGRTTPVDGRVSATAYNLNGQLKDLQMRRITEGSSVYFIGEVGISGDEILVFNIEAAALDGADKYTIQFKREFFSG
jgi:predicted small lipoprotein YifL